MAQAAIAGSTHRGACQNEVRTEDFSSGEGEMQRLLNQKRHEISVIEMWLSGGHQSDVATLLSL